MEVGGFSGTIPLTGTVGVARGGASHGAQPPTARTDHSSNLAVFMGMGPGIRAGYERDTERLGLIEIATIDRRHFSVVRPRHIDGHADRPAPVLAHRQKSVEIEVIDKFADHSGMLVDRVAEP